MNSTIKFGLAIASVALVLGIIFYANHSTGSGGYPFQVGSPGVGQPAPPIDLASTTGGRFRLASQHRHTVLLFFEEGVDCEPCWAQIKDIQANWSQFRALGIDKMISITGNPLSALKLKVADEGITSPVLADPSLTVSQTYNANQYGMMGTSADGHTFIVVGPSGTIEWRADYGGPPDYIMDVPIPNLLRDLRNGLKTAR